MQSSKEKAQVCQKTFTDQMQCRRYQTQPMLRGVLQGWTFATSLMHASVVNWTKKLTCVAVIPDLPSPAAGAGHTPCC